MSTDKVDAEIPSPAAGVLLEIKVNAGETVEVGSVVAILGEAGEQPEASISPEVEAPSPSDVSKESPPEISREVSPKSTPIAKKIAKEHEVEINSISGSGARGRITKQDVLDHIEGVSAEKPSNVSSTKASGVSSSPVAPAPSYGMPSEIPAAYRAKVYENDRVETMSGMRSKIAEHMVVSKHVSPHVGTVWEVDFSHVASLRKKYKAVWQEKYGLNLTFTSFVLKATVQALMNTPVLNASLDGDRIIYHRDVNLGIAVALDWGLIVPVIHNAGELNLLGLTRKAEDLAQRARSKKLGLDEIQNGTFTITNPGVFGPMFGIPVINQPQVGILGVGAIEKRPVVIDDMLAISTRAYMSMSFDHRLVDGADADKFMKDIKVNIENFSESDL